MFVAPLSMPSTAARVRPGPHMIRPVRGPVAALAGWLLAGLVALALVPALRGGTGFGATLPFWLVAAPAIDLGWLARARIASGFAHVLRRVRRRAPTQARRLQSARRALRSSR